MYKQLWKIPGCPGFANIVAIRPSKITGHLVFFKFQQKVKFETYIQLCKNYWTSGIFKHYYQTLLNFWASGIFQQNIKFKNCAKITGRPGFSNILTHPCEITGRPVFFREKKTLKRTNNCEEFLDVRDFQTLLLSILLKLLDVWYFSSKK